MIRFLHLEMLLYSHDCEKFAIDFATAWVYYFRSDEKFTTQW